jgi:tetratricopeptide (TPR) repeat protein
MAGITALKRPPINLQFAMGLLLASACFLLANSQACAGPFDELPEDRWAKLREVERYQLNIAEKLYKANDFKSAADEYEKYLKLYDRSEGAAFAQLKWSHCQVKQRHLNTAIRDGYQSVIDYFPESPEAVSAAYLIGETSKDMGDLKAAKKAYDKVLATHPKHLVAVLARRDLAEIAVQDRDEARRVALLRELTFDADRKLPAAANVCSVAARQLTQHLFSQGDFEEGRKALATTFKEDDLPVYLMHPQHGRLPPIIADLVGQMDAMAKQRGEKLADAAAAWFKEQAAADLKDEKRRPRALQCWYYVADLQGAAKRPEQQRQVYEQMLQTVGANDDLLGRLATWYKTANRRDEARKIYAQFKDPIEGQYQTAHSLREEKKIEPAVAIFRQLAGQDKERAARWLNEIASTYRSYAGQADQAIAIYRELLTADAGKAAAYHWEIAQTLYDYGRWKEALQAFKGTENAPLNFQRMAHCNRQLKQFGEAVVLYQHIAANYPEAAAPALLELARTQEQAGQTEPAIATYKRLCDRYAKTEQASVAHNHLNDKYKIRVTLGGAKD